MLEPVITSRAAYTALAVNFFALHGFGLRVDAPDKEKHLFCRRSPYAERVKRREHLAQRAGDLEKLLVQRQLAAFFMRGAGG